MDRQNLISRRNFNVSILAIATAALMPTGGKAHVDDKVPSMSAVRDDMVKATMLVLRAKTEKLGEPKIEGKDPLAGKDAPALYFGTTKMNNSSDVVDKVVKENGGAATLFVKTGDGYVRVATTMKKDDGSSALGTVLDANSPAIAMITRGETYYGDATIFGKPYATGYEPIKDASGNVIGIYFVGYMK